MTALTFLGAVLLGLSLGCGIYSLYLQAGRRVALDGAVARLEALRSPMPTESPASLLAGLVRERFLVSLDTGETFSGLLLDVDDRSVVLADVKLVREQQAPTDVAGQLVLERARVTYLQKP